MHKEQNECQLDNVETKYATFQARHTMVLRESLGDASEIARARSASAPGAALLRDEIGPVPLRSLPRQLYALLTRHLICAWLELIRRCPTKVCPAQRQMPCQRPLIHGFPLLLQPWLQALGCRRYTFVQVHAQPVPQALAPQRDKRRIILQGALHSVLLV